MVSQYMLTKTKQQMFFFYLPIPLAYILKLQVKNKYLQAIDIYC